jgi:hypothetical protein
MYVPGNLSFGILICEGSSELIRRYASYMYQWHALRSFEGTKSLGIFIIF